MDLETLVYEECYTACLVAAILYGEDAAAHLDHQAIADRICDLWLVEDGVPQ